MRYSALDTETPEGNIALICTPTESYNVETWEEFTSRFMVRKNLKTLYYTWNIRFDAQAILKLLPYEKLVELWKAKDNRIEYEGYRITYIPKKMLIISKIEGKKGAIHLYDASQYYEHNRLDKMGKKYLGTGKLPDVSAKEIGKSRKYYNKNYKKIVEYCKRDADLTLKLAQLAMKNIEKLGFNPSNPISPASISRKYQRKRGFPKKLTDMSSIELKANQIAALAYKGGVFATYKRGFFDQPLYDYDVNSCYPAIMIELPDWRNGSFYFIPETEPETFPEYGWILCDIDTEYIPHQSDEHYVVHEIYKDIGEWDMKYTAKKVTYPTGLRTVVITTEEYRWLREKGEYVKYLGEGMGWKRFSGLEGQKYPNPFAWLKGMYEKRKKIKKTNPALATTIKLLMNSLYGSCVQRKNGIGDLSNFCYGSYITGRARIQMFDVVKENYPFIVNVATDGILSTKKLGGENYENTKNHRTMEEELAQTSLHVKSRGERRNLDLHVKRTLTDTWINKQNDGRNEYTKGDNIRTLKEDNTTEFSIGDKLGEWEYTEYTKGLVIGNGIRQLWRADGTFETHARGITSNREYDLLSHLQTSKLKTEISVGRDRVIQLGTMVNAHLKWKHEHLNTFVFQSRVLNVNTDKKRQWEREYKDFRDLLESDPMSSEPIKMGDL